MRDPVPPGRPSLGVPAGTPPGAPLGAPLGAPPGTPLGAPLPGAVWRLPLGLLLLLAWMVPAESWPLGLGGPVERLWALLPALAYAGTAFAFARTLRPGEEALIQRYNRFDTRRDPVACAGYARGLTLFWAVALGLAAALALGLWWQGVDPGWRIDLVLLALFLAEHAVRSLRFPAGGIAWPQQTLLAILRAEAAKAQAARGPASVAASRDPLRAGGARHG